MLSFIQYLQKHNCAKNAECEQLKAFLLADTELYSITPLTKIDDYLYQKLNRKQLFGYFAFRTEWIRQEFVSASAEDISHIAKYLGMGEAHQKSAWLFSLFALPRILRTFKKFNVKFKR